MVQEQETWLSKLLALSKGIHFIFIQQIYFMAVCIIHAWDRLIVDRVVYYIHLNVIFNHIFPLKEKSIINEGLQYGTH